MTTSDSSSRASRKQTVVNWVLALSTVLGVLLVEVYAFARVMGTAACSDQACPQHGPNEFLFGLITYGAPVVAVAAIVITAFTGRRARGWVVPTIAWALLIVAFVVLLATFGG